MHRITAVMAKKETVAKLIKQRWELTNVTPFGYYLHCTAKDFALENKDCTFEDHHIPLVEDMWRVSYPKKGRVFGLQSFFTSDKIKKNILIPPMSHERQLPFLLLTSVTFLNSDVNKVG